MNWELQYLPEVQKDLEALSRNQLLVVRKAIKKVKVNPLPQDEGGYGKPLGHKHGKNLTGFLKAKLRSHGIRIVYKLIRTETKMLVVVVGMREDESVYELAKKRISKHNL